MYTYTNMNENNHSGDCQNMYHCTGNVQKMRMCVPVCVSMHVCVCVCIHIYSMCVWQNVCFIATQTQTQIHTHTYMTHDQFTLYLMKHYCEQLKKWHLPHVVLQPADAQHLVQHSLPSKKTLRICADQTPFLGTPCMSPVVQTDKNIKTHKPESNTFLWDSLLPIC